MRFKGLGGGFDLLNAVDSTTWFSTKDWNSEVTLGFFEPFPEPFKESFRSKSLEECGTGGGVWFDLKPIVLGTDDVESFAS